MRTEADRGGRGRTVLVTAIVVAAACRTDRPAAPIQPPPGMDSVPIANHVLYVPSGFRINIFREGLNAPRFMALAPDGSVYVSQWNAGSIVRLIDADHNGVAESSSVAHSGLTLPHGLAFRGDTLYVVESDGVIRYDPGSATPAQVVSNLPATGHNLHGLAFGPDNLMYVSVGSSCNICIEGDSLRAAVLRYNLNGTGGRVFASGLRNSEGLAFNSTTGALWATNNDRDNIGQQGPTNDVAFTDSSPPERINILTLGGNYGWPQCWLPNRANPEYSSANCSAIVAPAITFTAHSAPLGIAFYTGSMFPGYSGDAFVAYHGSWNRTVPTGAKVVRVHVSGGVPVSIEDFVVGWQLSDYSRWGRPVGLLVMPDGALLISDDASGRIWRVSYGN